MMKTAIVWASVFSTSMVGTWSASANGWGMPKPDKQPVSIREGSKALSTSGNHKTRYFVGGGIHGGK